MEILFALCTLFLLSTSLVMLISLLINILRLKKKIQKLTLKIDELIEMFRLSAQERQEMIEQLQSAIELDQKLIAFLEKSLQNRRGGTPKWNH